MVRARVLTCVDGVNIALLQKAINEQRNFFRERECGQAQNAQPGNTTWSVGIHQLKTVNMSSMSFK